LSFCSIVSKISEDAALLVEYAVAGCVFVCYNLEEKQFKPVIIIITKRHFCLDAFPFDFTSTGSDSNALENCNFQYYS